MSEAVPFGLAAASCFALSYVLQFRVAAAAPAHLALSPALLVHLARRPVWLLGVASSGAGVALESLALSHGSLVLVEALLATGLPLALAFAAIMTRALPSAAELAGGVAVSAGVGLLVVVGDPQARPPAGSALAWAAAVAACASASGAAATLARRRTGASRAAGFAVGAGIGLGLADALAQASLHRLEDGPGALLGSWQPYLLVLVALCALLLAQSAYQAGRLALALSLITLCEPLAGSLVGVAVFGDQLATSPPTLAVETGAILLAAVGAYQTARSRLLGDRV